MGEVYATRSDVAARASQALSADAERRVDMLCDDASAMLRERWGVRINAGLLGPETLKRIVCAMVNRAVAPGAGQGLTSFSEGVGPFNANAVYSNPDGALYVSKQESAILSGTAGGSKAFTINLWSDPPHDWCA